MAHLAAGRERGSDKAGREGGRRLTAGRRKSCSWKRPTQAEPCRAFRRRAGTRDAEDRGPSKLLRLPPRQVHFLGSRGLSCEVSRGPATVCVQPRERDRSSGAVGEEGRKVGVGLPPPSPSLPPTPLSLGIFPPGQGRKAEHHSHDCASTYDGTSCFMCHTPF